MNANPPLVPMPPLVALAPQDDGRNLLQSIPEEIMKHMVSFCDLPSLVLLAATCQPYQRLVFRECPSLWEDIDFGKVPQAARLTDTALNALLTNVNARNVTTSLSLMGCTNVRGQGLEPLRNSQKLEIIELRKTREEWKTVGETGLDDAYVTGILRSMAPINEALPGEDGCIGLKHVKIRRQRESDNHYQSFNVTISDFLSALNGAIAQQVREQRITCKGCLQTLAERIPLDDFHWKAPTCFCSKCKIISCSEDNCEVVNDCLICMEQFCGACRFVTSCDICGNFFCDECRYMGFCSSEQCRGNFYCAECRLTMFCELCDAKSWCEECRLVTSCEGCKKQICEECRSVKVCALCGCNYCSECDPVDYCQACKMNHCKDCRETWCHLERKNTRSVTSHDEEVGEQPLKRTRT
jgi:hypothetical protein